VSASLLLRSQTGGRSTIRLKQTSALIFACATALLSSSCQRPAAEDLQPLSATARADGTSNETVADPPIAPPQGFGKVSLTIENRQPLQLSLLRVVGNDLIPVERPIQRTNQFEVDSGFYLLRSKDRSVQYPVPAIAPFVPDNRLSLRIDPVPEPKPGWCWIPSGPAIIGDTLGVGREDERPARIVDLPGFWLAEKEVTNRQYADFLSSQETVDESWIDLRSRKCLIQKETDGKYSIDSAIDEAGEMPVVMVSLTGALAYCDWLSSETGQLVRLPSEREWEKAARGPESFVYSYGNIYRQAFANQESGKLKPAGSYQPNSFGLYDMTGNVFEWMSDKADFTKMETTLNHSLRGGSFVLDGMYLRNSFRMRQSPTVMTDDIGFRVVLDTGSKSNAEQSGNE